MINVYENTENVRFQYVLGLADDSLILGQRWAEWLGHAPALELDIAASNISLDLTGQAQLLLEYAGKLEGKDRDGDALAFHRDAFDFRNHLLVEQPNDDWGVSIARQAIFSSFQYALYEKLAQCQDQTLSEIASKAVKEVAYHRRYAADWCVRLAQGTEEANARVQLGFDKLWRFTPELFEANSDDQTLAKDGLAVDASTLFDIWSEDMNAIFDQAGLTRPADCQQQIYGRRKGHHTEHLGRMLTDMQFLPRSYPDAVW